MTICILPSSKKLFFTTGTFFTTRSLVKLITLFKDTPGICLTYCFSFYLVIAIFDAASCIIRNHEVVDNTKQSLQTI